MSVFSILRPVPKRSLRHDLTRQLIIAIFRHEFDGAQHLVEEELAARFGVSRTPVREAFSELAALGMVEIRPGKGVVLRHFGKDELRELYAVRGILEREATRLACGRAPRDQLSALRSRMASLLGQGRPDAAWSRKTIALDKELHDLISAFCGNARLVHEIGRYRQLVQAVREAIGRNASAQKRAVMEHVEILDRLIAEDAEGAAASMYEHIQGAAQAAIDDMFIGEPGARPRATRRAPSYVRNSSRRFKPKGGT